MTPSARQFITESFYNNSVVDMTPSDQLDATFIALADPTRRAILARLMEGEASVNELAAPFDISQPAVSKHIKILERAGLVTREQLARSRRYAVVAAAAVAAVLTPPDVVSMLMLLVPLYGLYEFAILAIRITHWRAARRAARSEAKNPEAQTEEGPEAPPGGGRVGGSGPI